MAPGAPGVVELKGEKDQSVWGFSSASAVSDRAVHTELFLNMGGFLASICQTEIFLAFSQTLPKQDCLIVTKWC